MNLSRNVFLPAALVAAIALPAAAFAQATPPTPAPQSGSAAAPSQAHHRRGGWMRAMHGITLSDAQKAQIKQYRGAFKAAHPKGSAPDPQARKALRDQILSVLTPAQKAQYESNLQQLRRQHPSPVTTPQP